jgi:hypothetical protein
MQAIVKYKFIIMELVTGIGGFSSEQKIPKNFQIGMKSILE